ncbi:MAG: TIGR01906 family membrane protein [Aerococcus sp.]|nr:TIGR01906 family membrane protein [Aerococcus sp.]
MSARNLFERTIEGIIQCVWAITGGVSFTLLFSPLLLAGTLITTGTLTTVPWSLGLIMKNYFQLLAYLIFPWVSALKMTDFPTSPSAALHFMEVKHLFWFALVGFVMASGILFFWIQWLRVERRHWLMTRSIRVAEWLPVIFFVLVLVLGFDTVFVGFHHLFFHNNAWLFDPATDPIIEVLTETFFLICAVMVVVVYEGELWWLKHSILKR